MRALAIVLACAGCGFDRVGGGLDAATGDGASADGASSDGASGDGATSDGGGPCATPALLVAMGTLGGGNTPGGAVVRFAIDPVTGLATRCATLLDGKQLPLGMQAIATFQGDVVLVAAETIFVLDAAHDGERWRYASTLGAAATEVFEVDADRPYVGVGWHFVNPSITDRVDLFADASGSQHHWLLDGMNAPIGSVVALSASPTSRARVFALTAGTAPWAATDWDPFAGTATPYANYPAGANLLTLATVPVKGETRSLWIDGMTNQTWFANDTGPTSTALQGPTGYCDSTCKLIDAVPDPSDATQAIAICEPVTGRRQVVRYSLSAGTTCATVYDGADFDASVVAIRLAIQP
jgi:hypothetical protein